MTALRAEAVLFDKDGTLFDFNATWASWVETMLPRWSAGDTGLAARLADAMGFDRTARVFLPGSVVVAGTPVDTARVLAPVFGITPAELVERLAADAAAATMIEAVPLAPFLAGLAGMGLRLGLATNDAEAPARAHLAAAGIAPLFDYVAGFDSGHGGKPDPGMLLAFADAVGIAPGRIVMVGDSLHDLHAGRAAGMQTVAVLTGVAGAETLAPLADAVVPDIGHLPEWLSGGD